MSVKTCGAVSPPRLFLVVVGLAFPTLLHARASDMDTLYPRSSHDLIFAIKNKRGTSISPRSAVLMKLQPEMGLIFESSLVSRRSSDLRSGPLRCIFDPE
jgi:hypothetical protein